MHIKLRWSGLSWAGWLVALVGAPARADAPRPIDFAHDIVPILKARCAECHTSGKYKGGLSLDSRAALLKSQAVVPGKSGASELVKRITSRDPDERMPPKGRPLSAQEVALVRAWIDQGLPWQEGFTFTAAAYVPPLKPRRPALPPLTPTRPRPASGGGAALHPPAAAHPAGRCGREYRP